MRLHPFCIEKDKTKANCGRHGKMHTVPFWFKEDGWIWVLKPDRKAYVCDECFSEVLNDDKRFASINTKQQLITGFLMHENFNKSVHCYKLAQGKIVNDKENVGFYIYPNSLNEELSDMQIEQALKNLDRTTDDDSSVYNFSGN